MFGAPTVGMIKDHFFYLQYGGEDEKRAKLWTLAPDSSQWLEIGRSPITWYDSHQGPRATVIDGVWCSGFDEVCTAAPLAVCSHDC
jgi:hypothetical protein